MVFGCENCCNRNGYQQINAGSQGQQFGVRHIQCLLVFCGLAVAYALRVNLSVAIVAMTDRNSTNPDFEEFEWDESIKSYLLSSFFWGYVITQVPGGYLSQIYGAKYTFFYGVLICSCLAVLTPFCAEVGDWPLVLVLRAVQGLCQGMIFPSTHTFLSRWAPPEERGRLVSYCYAGAQFGTFVMLSVSGVIASSWLGWPSIFYISGVTGIVWATVWYFYCASMPAQHPTITLAERRYIESPGLNERRLSDAGRYGTAQVPWSKIFTSLPFLTLLLVHCANNWGFWTLLTEMPSYMKHILGFNIQSNALLSGLPYLVMFMLCFVFSAISTVLNTHNCMSLNFSRKFFNTIGQWVPMVSLICLGYVGVDQRNLAIVLLTITVGINSATYLGSQVNHIDLSPNYAGTLMGITNCAANVISIIAPLTVGLIVTDEQNPLQWRIVFFVSAGFYFVGNLLFIVFGRTSAQSWNFPDSSSRRSTANTASVKLTDDEDENENEAAAPLNSNET